MRSLRRFAIPPLVAALLALAACSSEDDDALEPLDTGPGIPYTVRFEGPIDSELQAMLDRASAAQRDIERPPSDEMILTQRARGDIDNLRRAMMSLGYYDGTASWRVRPTDPGTTATPDEPAPQTIVFTLDPGHRYRLGQIAINVTGDAAPVKVPTTRELGLRSDQPVDAATILAAEQDLLRRVRKQSRPFARLGDRTAVIDRDKGTLDLGLFIEPGPPATFGTVTFTGIDNIEERFLKARLTFKPGDPYDPDVIEESRQALVGTQLFATVETVTPDHLEADGSLPVTFKVVQRAQRTIAAGLSYQTDQGPGVNASWEHRNFLGGGETFTSSLLLSQKRYLVQGRFREPDFLQRNQALILDAQAQREDTDAYKSDSISVGAGIERKLWPNATGTLGVAYKLSNVEQFGNTETYGLISVPGTLDWDTTNSVLDPTRGGRLLLQAAPYFDTLGSGDVFLKMRATYSHYLAITRNDSLVLALRGSVGSITGASLGAVPPDERFYAGGGGSIRGVGFQLAGPLDANGDPIGGLSIVEFNSELRWRFAENIGLATFLDGGSAFADTNPFDSDGDLRFGAGVGLRYYTPIGPIRLDVAVPLNRRKDVDDEFQVYVSIGQAF